MEIERKFTICELPDDLEEYESKKLEQGYLCVNPVVRVRKIVKGEIYHMYFVINQKSV